MTYVPDVEGRSIIGRHLPNIDGVGDECCELNEDDDVGGVGVGASSGAACT